MLTSRKFHTRLKSKVLTTILDPKAAQHPRFGIREEEKEEKRRKGRKTREGTAGEIRKETDLCTNSLSFPGSESGDACRPLAPGEKHSSKSSWDPAKKGSQEENMVPSKRQYGGNTSDPF